MKSWLSSLTLPLLLAACAAPAPPPGPAVLPEGLRVNLVTARAVAANRTVQGVTDRFTLDGQVVAYATFTWTNLDEAWGVQKLTFLWYNGDRLIRRAEPDVNFGRSPHHVWSTTQPTSLGAGNCRVEVQWHGRKLAQRTFRVFDPTTPAPEPPGPST